MKSNNNIALVASLISFHSTFNRDNMTLLFNMGFNIHLIGNVTSFAIDEQKDNEFKKFCSALNAKIHVIPIPRSPINLIQLMRAYSKLNKIILLEQIDYIHSHTPTGGFISRLSSHKNSIKNIYTAHGFHFYRGASIINWLLYFPVEFLLSRFTEAIITINKEDYRIANMLINTKTYYVPGVGININSYKSTNPKNDSEKIRLISVGELNKNKNHMFVIRCLSEDGFEGCYKIAGNGKLKKYLDNKINNYSLEKNVRLLGYSENIISLLNESDLFIFPSKREGLPISLLEAMAMGLPIIASDIRGNRELVDQGKGGFLYRYNDSDDFKAKLNILTSNGDLRRKMGNYNKHKARFFDISIISNQMEIIYTQILK